MFGLHSGSVLFVAGLSEHVLCRMLSDSMSASLYHLSPMSVEWDSHAGAFGSS